MIGKKQVVPGMGTVGAGQGVHRGKSPGRPDDRTLPGLEAPVLAEEIEDVLEARDEAPAMEMIRTQDETTAHLEAGLEGLVKVEGSTSAICRMTSNGDSLRTL